LKAYQFGYLDMEAFPEMKIGPEKKTVDLRLRSMKEAMYRSPHQFRRQLRDS
jgi:hypothetical protein